MLLAIDAGNTNTVLGVWDGAAWRAVWRRQTDPNDTEDQLAVWLKGLFDLSGLELIVDGVVIASVVPGLNESFTRMSERWLGVQPRFLRAGRDVGLEVDYEPPHAVGADRIANALAAIPRY
ncbi:MAG TPA: type III pantothenate kinase, partial [Fimbriimonadaceae bacterium]|nr:type III pantothenate kinase [Fimbriimonadaceae bacterium]